MGKQASRLTFLIHCVKLGKKLIIIVQLAFRSARYYANVLTITVITKKFTDMKKQHL